MKLHFERNFEIMNWIQVKFLNNQRYIFWTKIESSFFIS